MNINKLVNSPNVTAILYITQVTCIYSTFFSLYNMQAYKTSKINK